MLVTPLDSIVYLMEIRNVCFWLSFLHNSLSLRVAAHRSPCFVAKFRAL